MKKEYLGAVEWDEEGQMLRLTAENGIVATNTIYLGSREYQALLYYVERLKCEKGVRL